MQLEHRVMTELKRFVPIVGVAFLLSLGLAACGEGGDLSNRARTPRPSSRATPRPPPKKLRSRPTSKGSAQLAALSAAGAASYSKLVTGLRRLPMGASGGLLFKPGGGPAGEIDHKEA